MSILFGGCVAAEPTTEELDEAYASEEVAAATEAEPNLATAQQALSVAIQDPQTCSLPQGRYVVLASPTTNMANTYNITFHNDGIEGNSPSAGCKTMTFVWNEGTDPQPPQLPAQDKFYAKLFEGWWNGPTAVPRRFSVKGVWTTTPNQGVYPGVVTHVNNQPARGYALMFDDFGMPYHQQFNWMVGSDWNRSRLVQSDIPGSSYTIAITGESTGVVQRLYLESGSARITLANIATRPHVSGTVDPPMWP